MEQNVINNPETTENVRQSTGQTLWDSVLATLRKELSGEEYTEYFETTRPSYFDGQLLVVEIPSSHHRGWIIQNGLDRI